MGAAGRDPMNWAVFAIIFLLGLLSCVYGWVLIALTDRILRPQTTRRQERWLTIALCFWLAFGGAAIFGSMIRA